MNAGDLNKGQLQAWALNRYCYQAIIPIKDSVILSRMTDPALRRVWRQRIIDHDGDDDHDGGIARWFVLAEGLGLERDYVASQHGALPATRFAVEAYVNFVREKSLLEAIASSLTEMFAPETIRLRVSGMLAELRLRHAAGARLFRQASDARRRATRISLSTMSSAKRERRNSSRRRSGR